jgi:hypothetical protein
MAGSTQMNAVTARSVPDCPAPAEPKVALPNKAVESGFRGRGSLQFLRGLVGQGIRAVGSLLEWLFGAAVLLAGLAMLAALPLLQFLSLGYLLEASGRLARCGRIRDGFIGVRLAARLGTIVLGSWLFLLPVRLVADLTKSAQIIDPAGRVAGAWRGFLLLLTVVTALHIAAACARGGRLRYFFWPFNIVWLIRRLWRGGYYTESRDAVWETVMHCGCPTIGDWACAALSGPLRGSSYRFPC